MRKFSALILAVLGALGFYFFKHYEIRGLEDLLVVARASDNSGSLSAGPSGNAATWNPTVDNETIRIASFNIQVFGVSKARDARVMDILAQVVRKFDIVAIQEIRAKDQTIIPRFVEQVNATGARYAHVLGPRLGRTSSKEQYAFVFNTQTIEVDHSATYTISDPSDRLHREPLISLFRARTPAGGNPFTFQLVNIHTDPDEVKTEVEALADVYRAVVSDGTNERDVIILGDLNASEHQLGSLGAISGMTCAILGQTTNTRRTKSYDNLVFHAQETNEYTGRNGVLDLLREFNLTEKQALAVSDHLPVWAEFSIYEGAGTQRVATRFNESVGQ
ncbi:MAG: endonuclease/exonuclease/phosphatase [Planctomycetota bacterium]|mgnify:CR=1 FL=1|nr:MAG: endonuclease/exonuclease/phosphatase [Planctomycetota bacterium]REJ89965.1 MAG: endonuclease/exonuclease/phosphatase [Planctomycetota bacterium]REK28197.1 MAG: endonuclease/exonuclease/phosphatase [Planctomycetota bacterium]REK42455.1 MAG: endonuclease/exonuclease/phosphatase [Planctomycetota bacterium]